jgi:3-isopropylmalate dehydratase small subunit
MAILQIPKILRRIKMVAKGKVFRYEDNVDTDVIIPARYLNTSDPKELASNTKNTWWVVFWRRIQT